MVNGSTQYLAHVGELSLKKGNRRQFEVQLERNLTLMLRSINPHVTVRAGRLYLSVPASFEAQTTAEQALSCLLGITGWAAATACPKTMEAITRCAHAEATLAAREGKRTFRIEARRADKRFCRTSSEIAREVGAVIHQSGALSVDLHYPDVVIFIEVREREAFLYGARRRGLRGLPCGVSGRGLLLLSGGIDSPVAGYRMLSRGMHIDCLYFHSYPYTPPEAQKKVEDLAKVLARYGLSTTLTVVSLTDIQKQLQTHAPAPSLTLLLRMCMMRIAEHVAREQRARCLITGESLAQVASQTLENLTVTSACTHLPIFRPLIGADKEDIIRTATEIGTYAISIRPYEDCCTLFAPKHPVLRPEVEEMQKQYQSLMLGPLLEEAFRTRKRTRIYGNYGVQESGE